MLCRCDSCRENDITQPASRENWKRCHARQTGGKKRNFNWMLSEVLSLLFVVYSAKWWKKKSPCKCGKRKERSRDSPLMSIWRVFCLSRDLFVLLLIPQSSIPLSLCEKKMLPGREARHGLLTGTANWIQLAWPEIFLHIWTVTKSFRVAPWVCI